MNTISVNLRISKDLHAQIEQYCRNNNIVSKQAGRPNMSKGIRNLIVTALTYFTEDNDWDYDEFGRMV